MADKKSIKLYLDSLDVLDTLSKEQIGELFLAIRAYEVEEKEILEGMMRAVFVPFKNNIDRAKEAYNKAIEVNRINGKKGGRPKTQKNPKKPNGFIENPKKPNEEFKNPKKPYKDKDKDIDISLALSKQEKKEIFSSFDTLWKDYTLTFLKEKKQSGGSKEQAKKKYLELSIKHKCSEIYNFVEDYAAITAKNYENLEQLLTEEGIEQYYENRV